MCENLFTRDYFPHSVLLNQKKFLFLKYLFYIILIFAVCPINPEHNFDIVTMPYASLRTLSYTKADLYKIEKYIRKGIVIDNEKLSGFLPKRMKGIEPSSPVYLPMFKYFLIFPPHHNLQYSTNPFY